MRGARLAADGKVAGAKLGVARPMVSRSIPLNTARC
jgi:hypothetical protein